MKNWFAELNAVDVGDHIETKNGLSYVSWTWAWQELMKRYPLSYSKVYEREDGSILWPDPVGAHVKVSVTIVWEEQEGLKEHEVIEYFPVKDFRNKSFAYDNIDSMTLNTTVQRALTKCIARLGLGLYVYAGEDMPEEPEDVKREKASTIKKISSAVMKITKEMTAEEKRKFANETLIPTIGTTDWNKCGDLDKLKELLEKLSTNNEKSAA